MGSTYEKNWGKKSRDTPPLISEMKHKEQCSNQDGWNETWGTIKTEEPKHKEQFYIRTEELKHEEHGPT